MRLLHDKWNALDAASEPEEIGIMVDKLAAVTDPDPARASTPQPPLRGCYARRWLVAGRAFGGLWELSIKSRAASCDQCRATTVMGSYPDTINLLEYLRSKCKVDCDSLDLKCEHLDCVRWMLYTDHE